MAQDETQYYQSRHTGQQIDDAVEAMQDLAENYYDKQEVNSRFTEERTSIDEALSEFETEVNAAILGKADKSNTYTKQQVDAALTGKADKSETYTKTAVNSMLSQLRTLVNGDTDTKISALGTLMHYCGDLDFFESAERSALYTAKKGAVFNVPFPFTYNGVTYPADTFVMVKSDSNDPSRFSERVHVFAPDLSGKVDKVAGKGLSANDYTTTEKNKLAGLPTSSELNTTFGGKVDNGKGILALALAAGFTYDAQTGTYTRSWISDVYKDTFSVVGLTEEEVGRVIAVTSQPVDGYGWCSEGYGSRKIRCTGAVLQRYYRNTYNANGLCLWQSSLEVFYPCRDHIPMKVSNASHMFDDCTALRRTTAIDVSAITSTSGLDGMFNGHYSSQTGTRTGGCTALVDTFIKGLKVDFSLSESPNISLRSLQYLVDNAANTGAITVLLEQSRYIMVQNSQAEAYVNLRNAAAAKNISFGTI